MSRNRESPTLEEPGGKRSSSESRRAVMFALVAPALAPSAGQFPEERQQRHPFPGKPTDSDRLPDGKSQSNAIAKRNHELAMKDAGELVEQCQNLRSEIEKAGQYVVPVASVKRTEEIERLAKRIRGRLKG